MVFPYLPPLPSLQFSSRKRADCMLAFKPWAAGAVRLSEASIDDRAIIREWSAIGEVTGHAA
jgi:hypothetical protein